MAMVENNESRRAFENQLVVRLSEDDYDAVASYELIQDLNDIPSSEVRNQLLDNDVQAILILRPQELPEGMPISAQQLQISPQEFSSVSRFITAYQGDNLNISTIVQIAGFLLERDGSRLFWHGVIWLDDAVESEQNRFDKLVDLVQFNLNNSRNVLRLQLGLPPINGD